MRAIVFLYVVFSVITQAQAADFSVSSKSYKMDGPVPDLNVFSGFGCSGKNLSPELTWTNPPEGTKSFAVTIYDPDAPTGSGWWHWTAFNIPASVTNLAEGAYCYGVRSKSSAP
jgi:phosphatidylethanolamine-binding protein (PEBP) family uncharacterized protein